MTSKVHSFFSVLLLELQIMSLKVWWCQIMYLFCVQVAKVFSCPLPCLYSLLHANKSLLTMLLSYKKVTFYGLNTSWFYTWKQFCGTKREFISFFVYAPTLLSRKLMRAKIQKCVIVSNDVQKRYNLIQEVPFKNVFLII